ncbi:serine hydrolase [Flavitalea antarctica]
MHKSHRVFLVFTSCVILGLCFVPASLKAHQLLPDSVIQKLDQVVTKFMATSKPPAINVAIIHDQDIVYKHASGYTDVRQQVVAKADSKFPIMSITKTFTATMFMQLVEQGKVGLNDDVRKYIPEYKVRSTYNSTTPTTLLQLATHTSGLPRNSPADTAFTFSFERWMLTDGAYPIQPFATNKEVLHSLQYMKLDYPPYDFMHHNDRHYSNLGYTLLGIAIERAAKTSFSKYIQTNVLDVLGMTESGFLTEPRIGTEVAKGYRIDKKNGKTFETPLFEVNAAIYPGGMYSTASDMTKYIRAQYDDGDKILKTESRGMMRQLKIAWKPAYPYVLHEGGFPGHRSIAVFNPASKIGWVILTNSGDIDFGWINEQFANVLSAAYQKTAKLPLERYTGKYVLPGGYGSIDIYLKDDLLHSTYCQELLTSTTMKPDGTNRFKVEAKNGYSINYEFAADKSGNITGLRLGQFLWEKQ